MWLSMQEPTPKTSTDSFPVGWPDDDATLEATLALIDQWEFDTLASPDCSGTATDSEVPSSVSSQSPPPPSASPVSALGPSTANARRRKKRGDRDVAPHVQRREELEFLRDKIQGLEAQLASMQGQQGDGLTLEDGLGTKVVASRVWQDIAMRQLKHRQKSEAENSRLRVLVQEQLAVAKQLARVLMRAHTERDEAEDGAGATTATRIKLPRRGLREISVDDQRQRVLELYDERETAFSKPPFTTDRAVFREVNVLEHLNGETTINVASSWPVPFPMHRVTNAFWKSLVEKLQRMDGDFKGRFDDGKDEVMTRYEFTTVASRLVGKFLGRFVGRRFPTTDGHPPIIIGVMTSNPVDFKPMSMEGVQIHQEIIMRVVDVAEVQGDSTQEEPSGPRLSAVQLSSRMRIQFAGSGTPTRKRRVDALTNYLFSAVEDELAWKQEMLETLLLNDALKSSGSVA